MNRRGFTIIELLMAVVIGAIAMMALAIPFIAERSFFGTGKRQTEAQRDAQMALRALARTARMSTTYDASVPGQLSFTVPSCGTSIFERHAGGEFHLHGCSGDLVLIDGVRSRVASFTVTPIIANKLVRVQLQMTNRLSATDPRQRSELLVTELFLRNAT